MNFPNKEIIQKLRAEYPPGTKVELLEMSDPQAPEEGTIGTVQFIDDAGTIHIIWSTGSTLGVIPGIDRIRRLE